jgi:hypothetical protein
MTKATIAAGTAATLLLLLALTATYRAFHRNIPPGTAKSGAINPSTAPAAEGSPPTAEEYQGFLYGRIDTVDGATYEGRLRFGGAEEAFWGDFFNGFRHANPWVSQVPSERLPKIRRPIDIFGITIAHRVSPIDLRRQLVARFGEIARIEARGLEVLVTLKSGGAVSIDRSSASDFDDGVRVWDAGQGVVDLDSLRIRTIELLPTPSLGALPYRLQGTVRTRQGDFVGFVGWDRDECVGSDELDCRAAGSKIRLRFDSIRSIARRSSESAAVTFLDGREIVLSDNREFGQGNRGISVDDRRYGRVQISWEAFERVDFGPGGSGPAYGDFPPGHPLTGSVTTRAGRRLTGRLVYDLDESESTETLDAPSGGVGYALPFGRIASITLPPLDQRGTERARVTLHGGEELTLECTGDLGEGNAGMLIFVDGRERPEYLPWTEVGRVDLAPPPAQSPQPERRLVASPRNRRDSATSR